MQRIAILCLIGTLALGFSAQAAGVEKKDGNYIFGSQLYMQVSKQVGDNNMNYWSNSLPMEYMYSVGEIVKKVNAARKAKGITDMVDVTRYPVSPGGENPVDGGFEYDITFAGMSPEDVDVVLAAFPLTGAFSDAKLRVQPVNSGNYYGSSTGGDSITVKLPGGEITFSTSMSYNDIEKAAADKVHALFGAAATYDLSWSVYTPVGGVRNLNASLNVYLDASLAPVGGGQEFQGD